MNLRGIHYYKYQEIRNLKVHSLSEYSTTNSDSEHSAQNADSHLSDSAATLGSTSGSTRTRGARSGAAGASRSTRGAARNGVASCCTAIGETWK